MDLLIPASIIEQLQRELKTAGRREIGGMLFGEHIGDVVFRIVEISVQRDGGTSAHFVRDPTQHREQLEAFYSRTGDDCSRYNYLGEWHSHPSFLVAPSGEDEETMMQLLSDPDCRPNFVLLLIVRSDSFTLSLSATAYANGLAPARANVYVEVPHTEVKRRRRRL